MIASSTHETLKTIPNGKDKAKIIKRFKDMTGCPILVNTSFNVRGEPIVCSIEDAYNCFIGTNIDILVCNNFVLYKEDQKKNKVKNYHQKFELD